MENRFQEALNKIKTTDFSPEYWMERYVEDLCNDELETLQELINNYSKLEKALDKACELNISLRFDRDYPFEKIMDRESEEK